MLLEPGKIGNMELRNRIVFAPHSTCLGGEWGQVLDEMIAHYQRRAEGGAGLICIGTARVATKIDNFKLVSRQVSIDDNCFVPGLTRLTEAVHKAGSKISIQLQPGGGAISGIVGEHPGRWHQHLATEAVSPSGIPYPGKSKPRAVTVDEIREWVKYIAQGAYRAKLSGFDAVSVNAHAGYIIAQFLSPYFNKRTDEYGKDRMRFMLELIEAMRKAVGPDFPIIMRYTIATYPYPLDDTFEEREEVKEAQNIARRLEEAGVNAIYTSYNHFLGKFPLPPMHIPEDFAVPMGRALKKVVKIPIVLIGKMRDPEFADQVLKEGSADFIGMVRALVADPDLPEKYTKGRVTDIWSCIGCNECLRTQSIMYRPIRCAVNPTVGREFMYDYRKIEPAKEPKEVMVIGGGVAGMEAARVAAIRGHKVTLVEKEGQLGKRVELAAKLPKRKNFGDILSYYTTAFKSLRIEVGLCSEVTPELIEEMEKEGMMPDIFIVATGGRPYLPEVPGIEGKNVITFVDVMDGKAETGKKVVVVGANIVGMEVALFLAQQGKEVTLVEMPNFDIHTDIDGWEIDRNVQAITHEELEAEPRIKVVAAEKMDRVTERGVVFSDQTGKSVSYDADTTVISLGFTPENRLSGYLRSKSKEVYTIGNAEKTGKIVDAMYHGFVTALQI